LVRDICPGSYNSVGGELTAAGETLFFAANDCLHGMELWKSDGTQEGTVMVADIYQGYESSWPEDLINADGTLYFLATEDIYGRELWKSDGTLEGTSLVMDICPAWHGGVWVFLRDAEKIGSTLYFMAYNLEFGWEFWKSDGTAEGTNMVKDIYSGEYGSYPTGFIEVNRMLFFNAASDLSSSVSALWKSDGTNEGTFLVTHEGYYAYITYLPLLHH
jgi:ELWxxDGT repeat protein